jgi:signal transduction histidine kinase
MVQEALTNVARHARAHAVQISLGAHDSALGRELELVVTDDGIGIDDGALQRGGSFGLLGMRERALALGGRIEVGPAAGGGTTLRVRLPAKLGALAPSPRPPQPQVPGRPRRGGRPQ